jgi:hypothetical protein
MSSYPQGWYDDPDNQDRERYWDGERWTDDIRQKFQPGWYEDPKRFGSERYWNGSAWTDERRFVTRLDEIFPAVTFKKKDSRLVVAGDHVAWGDDSIRWDDVSGFDSTTRTHNGLPALYQIFLTADGAKMVIELVPPRGEAQRAANAFETIVDQAHRVITPRVLNDLFTRADAGETIEYEKVTLSAQGFAKGGKDAVPWSEYAGWRSMNALFEIHRHKGDKQKAAVKVNTTHLGRWVLSALVEDYASRYSKTS